jgi:hypothetical protein
MKIGVGMNIYYCEICGIRIPNAEVDKAQSSAGYVRHCSKCTPKAIPTPSQKQSTVIKTLKPTRTLTPTQTSSTKATRMPPFLIYISLVGIPVLIGAITIFLFKGRANPQGVVENDKPTTTTSERVAIQNKQADLGTKTIPIGALLPIQPVAEPVVSTATSKLMEPKNEKEVLFEEDFSKPATGYSGERIETESNFVLEMEKYGNVKRCEIAEWFSRKQRKISFIITAGTQCSFRINPGSCTNIGVRCFIESGKGYATYISVSPNVWSSHSLDFSKLKSEGSSETLPIGAKFRNLVIYTITNGCDAYLDDIIIRNDIAEAKSP